MKLQNEATAKGKSTLANLHKFVSGFENDSPQKNFQAERDSNKLQRQLEMQNEKILKEVENYRRMFEEKEQELEKATLEKHAEIRARKQAEISYEN